jgi:transcriptional regulator with XRE-family HTH domain
MIFPEKLLLLRKSKGLTQEELAEKIYYKDLQVYECYFHGGIVK